MTDLTGVEEFIHGINNQLFKQSVKATLMTIL